MKQSTYADCLPNPTFTTMWLNWLNCQGSKRHSTVIAKMLAQCTFKLTPVIRCSSLTLRLAGMGFSCGELTPSIKTVMTPCRLTYCKRMMQIYQSGVDHTTAAQVEARIPACSATTEMLDFPEDLLKQTLCWYPAVDWWWVKNSANI